MVTSQIVERSEDKDVTRKDRQKQSNYITIINSNILGTGTSRCKNTILVKLTGKTVSNSLPTSRNGRVV